LLLVIHIQISDMFYAKKSHKYVNCHVAHVNIIFIVLFIKISPSFLLDKITLKN